MKKVLLFVFMAAAICACRPNVCTIHGVVTSQVDSLWLIDTEENPIDSCAVQDGAFAFTTDRSTTSICGIWSKDESIRIPVIPETKDIEVIIGDGPAIVTGSPLTEEYNSLQQWLLQQFNDANEKAMELIKDGKSEEGTAVMKEMKQMLADHCKEVYLKHLDDPVGDQAMVFLLEGAIPDEEFIDLYKKGGDLIHNDAKLGGYYEFLTQSGSTVIQLQADGSFSEKEGTLDDFLGQGKYVLVDFWASWCGPCKKEVPFVVKAYNDYKDKGLVVLGVPVQDKKDGTKKVMADLGIYYPQILDPKQEQVDRYGFHSIPHLILFDPEGQIVKQGMHGEKIDQTLAEFLTAAK